MEIAFAVLEIFIPKNFPIFFTFLNQARVAACTWFLEIALVDMSVCVCVSAPEAINNQWHDMV